MMNGAFYQEIIGKLQKRIGLGISEAERVSEEILQNKFTPVQIAALLTTLSLKGESVQEIAGFAQSMRRHALRLEHSVPQAIDIVGTGGDARGTFNISTTAAFVVAGAGVPVAKHGNRGVSSPCGSADVLRYLGVQIDAPLETLKICLEECGITFLFAPRFHPAMKMVAPIRRELGFRTIFNQLGPLLNPAGVRRQVIGVFSSHLTTIFADALNQLDCEQAWIFSSEDGLDEITLTGPTQITELKSRQTRSFRFEPESFGFSRCGIGDLAGGESAENGEILRQILAGELGGAKRDVVLLNAAAGILVSGQVSSFEAGLDQARESLASGRAMAKLRELRRLSNQESDSSQGRSGSAPG
jgi:anthranilate phosphoribosyltransferase